MEIIVRKNIDLSRLRAEALFAWHMICLLASVHAYQMITLTSGHRDRPLGLGYSKHQDGLAIDFILDEEPEEEFLAAIRQMLPGYDVVYHADRDGYGNHCHVEWDHKV